MTSPLPPQDGTAVRATSIDSDLSSEIDDASTQSWTPQADDYTVGENGRTYRKPTSNGPHLLPTDLGEQARLLDQHHFRLETIGLHMAVLPQRSLKVLDLGAGTGQWAEDFAYKHDNTHVKGLEHCEGLLLQELLPSNCDLFIEDIEEPRDLGLDDIDFVHIGFVFIHNWQNIIRKAFRALKPGGRLEVVGFAMPIEIHGTEEKGGRIKSELAQWQELLVAGAGALDVDLQAMSELEAYLLEAGFEDVQRAVPYWPIGARSQNRDQLEFGRRMEAYGLQTIDALSSRILSAAFWKQRQGMGEDQRSDLVSSVKEETSHGGTPASMKIATYIACRPG